MLTQARFVAAIAVVWFHFGRTAVSEAPRWVRHIVESGYAGVPFFFLLSGFILVYASQTRDLSDRRERRRFWRRRFARIYPVYLLAWIFYLGAFLLASAIDGTSLSYVAKATAFWGGMSIVLVQAWVPAAAHYWNTPAWSLSCETLFYAAFPFLMGPIGRLSTRRLAGLLTVNMCLTMIANAVIVPLEPRMVLEGTLFSTQLGEAIRFFPLVQLPTFLAGVVLGHLYLRGIRVSRPAVFTMVAVVVSFVVLALPRSASLFGITRDVLFVPMLAAVLYGMAMLRVRGETAFGRGASLLGRASYAVYIIQNPLWWIYVSTTGIPMSPGMGPVLVFVVALTLLSIVIYQWYERPAERWLKGANVNTGYERRVRGALRPSNVASGSPRSAPATSSGRCSCRDGNDSPHNRDARGRSRHNQQGM